MTAILTHVKTVEPVLIWRMDIIVNVQRDIPEEIVLKVIIFYLQCDCILMHQRFYDTVERFIFEIISLICYYFSGILSIC